MKMSYEDPDKAAGRYVRNLLLSVSIVFGLPVFLLSVAYEGHLQHKFKIAQNANNHRAEQRAKAGTIMVILIKDGKVAHAGIANGYKESVVIGSAFDSKHIVINPDGLYQDRHSSQYRDVVTGAMMTFHPENGFLKIIEGNGMTFTKETLPTIGKSADDVPPRGKLVTGNTVAHPAP
jgi:hypothetical protein